MTKVTITYDEAAKRVQSLIDSVQSGQAIVHIEDLRALLSAAPHPAQSVDGPAITADVHRNAERYRWLAPKLAGYDFNWMPSSSDAKDGCVVAVFDVGQNFCGGRDIAGGIDTAIAGETKS